SLLPLVVRCGCIGQQVGVQPTPPLFECEAFEQRLTSATLSLRSLQGFVMYFIKTQMLVHLLQGFKKPFF
ncbi:MAG: hypothetical protein COB07_05270, partial [Sulfurovum sp.]